MRKITIPALATAISLAVFACSESPSSPSTDSSSSGVPSSSSVGINSSSSIRASSSSVLVTAGRACEYPSEDFGIIGLFLCGEAPSDMSDLQKYKTECEEVDDGTWINACPGGEKATCIYEEDDYDKEVLYKIYADGFTCGDLGMKNTDGSVDIVQKGGACGPFVPGENIPVSMCVELPELPTGTIKLSCAWLEVPFVSECPANANLICYNPEEDGISYLYGEAVSSYTCEDFGWEAFQKAQAFL